MILFSLPSRTTDEGGAMTPARYVRLRRRAAGMSVEAVAAAMESRERYRPEAAALIRMLETPGVTARHRTTLDYVAAVLPIDPDVYHQLATEPAERHPRVCHGCGCSAHDLCRGAAGVCTLEHTLCTRCAAEHA